MAKHVCLYKGNGRNAYRNSKGKRVRCYCTSYNGYQYLQRTFSWVGRRSKVLNHQLFYFFERYNETDILNHQL